MNDFPVFPKSGLANTGEFLRVIPSFQNTREGEKWIQLGDSEILTKYIFGKTAVDIYSFGQIGAESDLDVQVVTDLQPANEHMYQTRFGIFGAGHFYLYIPSTVSLGGMDSRQTLGSSWRELGYFDQWNAPAYNFSPQTERWYDKDHYPGFKIYNPTKSPISPEIIFVGKMFEVKEVADNQVISALESGRIPYRYVNMGGIKKISPR